MNSLTDQQLLQDFAGHRSEAAFAELVRRHLDFVYSAALRMVRDSHLAEDVAQGVFAALAQNARQLIGHPVLSGWLHRTAQNLAANIVRTDVRRRAREQEAAAMNELLATGSDPAWENIAAHLDSALGELSEPDRDALLLRYFERKSAQEMALTLGVSEEAAQKRVSRAVERLRELIAQRGLTVGAGGLVVLISANAVQSAPIGLAAAIATTAIAGAAVSTSTVIAATKSIAMNALQKTLVTATIAVLAGAGIYQARQAAQLRNQNQALEQQLSPLTAQIQHLQGERDDATNRLSGLQDEIAQTKVDNDELLKLRGEVTLLRNEVSDSVKNVANVTNEIASRWTNWNNGQSLGSFYAIAGTATETVAVGIDGRIATRNNSTGVWNIQTFTGDPDFRAIVHAGSQYVIVREAGSIMTSPDGLAWTNSTSPTKEDLLGLFWDGHQYLAGGNKGTILSSPDGINWTNRDSGSQINFSSFSYSGSRYIAVGNDGILVSSDSVTWTTPTAAPTSVPFTACTWTGTEFLACGLGLDKNPTIYTSPDADVWTLRDTTITASLRAAITIDGIIYVAGDSVIEQSVDGGTTWTDTFKNFGGNKLFMGLASDGESLIAAGFNHNVWGMPLSATP